MRFAVPLFCAVLSVALSTGAQAQTPQPQRLPLETQISVGNLTLSRALNAPAPTLNGSGCISGLGAGADAQTVNPITGKLQAQTIVSIPLTKGGPSSATATQRQQQREACARGR